MTVSLTNTKLVIRHGKQSDLPTLEWGGEYTHFRRLFAEAYQQVELGKALIWIAEIPQEDLIGQLFISLKSHRADLADGLNRAYLFGFRVRPAYRGMGVGSAMMLAVEEDLIKRGYSQLTLNVAQDNIPARAFYEHFGYRMIHSDPGKWSFVDDRGHRVDVNEPAWRMIKDLIGQKTLY